MNDGSAEERKATPIKATPIEETVNYLAKLVDINKQLTLALENRLTAVLDPSAGGPQPIPKEQVKVNTTNLRVYLNSIIEKIAETNDKLQSIQTRLEI